VTCKDAEVFVDQLPRNLQKCKQQHAESLLQWYASNFTDDCKTEIKFYLEIRTSVPQKATNFVCASDSRSNALGNFVWTQIRSGATGNT